MAVTVGRQETLSRAPGVRRRVLRVGLGTLAGPAARAGRPWRSAARAYQVAAVGLDAVLAVVAVAVVCAGVLEMAALVPVAAATAAVLVALIAFHRGYATAAAGSGPGELAAIFRAGVILAALVLAVAYLTEAALPRPLLLGALPVTLGAIAAGRLAQRAALRRARRRGRLLRPTIVVGDGERLGPLLAELRESAQHGYAPIGVCSPAPAEGLGVPLLGTVADVPRIVRETGAEAVVVSAACLDAAALRQLSWALEDCDVQYLVAPNLLDVGMSRICVQPAAGMPLLGVRVGAPRRRLLAKAVIDRLAGALLLLCAGVVLVPAALAVRLTSPGPAFYRQTRVGAHGRRFTMYKLRSMTTDADRRLADLAQHSDGNGTLFKMRQDPRVTPLGRVLRRYSIDELPQLWNVVRGDMSLVGPRPPLPEETATYDGTALRRLRVRPGLTGLWQVSGRSDLSWEQSVRLDLRYVDNWTVPMDVSILGRTVGAVFGGRGAY
ncbi:sugar transferase [Georgenia sp. SYP-B2076]|uniref:sugar transferase n=1 Tax=Georgenia sp. SYP-B2076 TaxID=2495881 RepID=UPI000F8CB513|nr:sugar transferase [Georgenia sp. SYP-B2076]